jgi:hypothetical protein
MSSDQPPDFTYGLDPDETVAEGVIEATIEVANHEATSLDPLYSVIDPDALNALFRPGHSGNPQVTFQYNGCEIQVTSDRNIVIWDDE